MAGDANSEFKKKLNYNTSYLLSFLAGKNTGELGRVEETQPVIVRNCDHLHNNRNQSLYAIVITLTTIKIGHRTPQQ